MNGFLGGKENLFDFGTLAPDYDQWYDEKMGGRFDRLEKRAMRSLFRGIVKKGTLLEIGSGTGWWSEWFSRMGFRVTGVDISWEMVAVAKKKKIANAAFVCEDGQRLSFLDNSFDVACAVTSLEFAREPETVIGEMVRCTRPGGHLILGILNADSPLNIARRKVPGSPYEWARFFSVTDLTPRLAPFGRVKILHCAYAPSLKLPPPLCGVVDDVMAFCGIGIGAFLAVKVALRG